MTQPTYDVTEYRFVEDDGTESGSSFIAALDTDIGRAPTPANRFRIRFQVQNTNSKGGIEAFDLEYNKGGAGWNPVDDTASANIRAIASAVTPTPPADGSDTTNRLTNQGGSFDTTNSGWSNTGVGTSDTFDASAYWEVEYCIYIIDADTSGGNTIQLRVVETGGDTTTMLSTPTVTVATNASDNQAAYIKGFDTASDNQAAYLKGGFAASDSKSAYILGTECPVVDIQSGSGSIKTCHGLNSYGNAIANTSQEDVVEALLKFTFDNNTVRAIFRVHVRGSEDWDDGWTPTKSYEALVNNDGGYTINRIVTASRTQIGTGAWTADTNAWWIRFRADGTHIRFKLWADSGSEPVAWDEDHGCWRPAAGYEYVHRRSGAHRSAGRHKLPQSGRNR
jgi:hypothetical protein